MARHVVIYLTATGQRLKVTEQPIIASAVVGYLRFEVELSQEWDTLTDRAVLVKNRGQYASLAIDENGRAEMAANVAALGGVLEVAIMGREGAQVLTTERVLIDLRHSGKERG